MSKIKAYLVSDDKRIDIQWEQITIGRLSSNLIPLNDATVSKNHAIINWISSENKFFLTDLNTVNGTYLNGSKLDNNKKYPVKHKDAIQFGKYVHLFHFYQVQAEHQKKGKINLKDYCFQLQSDEDLSLSKSVNSPVKGKVLSKPAFKPEVISKVSKPEAPNRQPKTVKIPNLEDYLELETSLLSSNPSFQVGQNKVKKEKYARQQKIELKQIKDEFGDEQIQNLRKQQQRRKNIYLQQKADERSRLQKSRALQQEKIRLEIQRHKQEQQMLRKQIELQHKIRQEQQRMETQKARIEDELLRRQQRRRQEERHAELEQQEKERRFIEQLQQQKQHDLKQIKQQQQMLRTKSETAMRQELEGRKKQLQTEAKALASQYQQIYKQTIRKMKNDIQKQQQEIDELQRGIQRSREQKAEFQLKIRQVGEAVDYSQREYDQVSGRNKAFILYASELQNRLDKLKEQRGEGVKKGNFKLREEIDSSRKLLSMKKGELKSLEDQVAKIRLTLNMDKRMSHTDMLDTILDNHQTIQKNKYIYFQYLREEKALKQMWGNSLEENDHLQQQNHSISKDSQNYKKQLLTNLRDNASRLTQQRLHMLKCLHYLPEDKKRAAKMLIEEMVTMQEQIRTMINDSEQAHEKIHTLITNSNRLKKQNQYFSELLFGADSTAHHFDNMKIEINDLVDRVGIERDQFRVQKRLKLGEQIQGNEIKIYDSNRKLQVLKNRWRQGLRGQKAILPDKNPIAFFGQLLTRKEAQLSNLQLKASQLERECVNIGNEVGTLQRRKGQLCENLQSFKREELAVVRRDLL